MERELRKGMSEPARPTGNTAILLIHGIGEQNPYETLDSFAQGLGRYFQQRGTKLQIRPERISHQDWTEVAVHLEFDSQATRNRLRRLSLFEFYWAPYTEGKVTYRGVLGWLIRTALTPLRYLSNNLQVLLEVEKKKNFRSIARVFLREIGRASLLYLPLLVIFVLLLFFLGESVLALQTLSQKLPPRLGQEANPIALAGVTICLVMVILLLIFIAKEFQHRAKRPGPSIQRVAETWWIGLAMLCLVFFLLVGIAIAWVWSVDVLAYLRLLANRGTLGLLLFIAGAWILRRVLVGYVGDVTVYVTADAKSANYQARSAILKESAAALARLLANPKYDQVIVAGHSLGSVIAYDTINKLLSRVWATQEQSGEKLGRPLSRDDLKKLRGLVTFGSPLDKIYYFFRQQVKADQVVRAQILSFLHSFRRARSGRTYTDFPFQYANPEEPGGEASAFPKLSQDFRWLNIWAPMDPVSGPLDFYVLDPDDQLSRWYPVWGLAHLDYWRDPKFYAFVGDRLL